MTSLLNLPHINLPDSHFPVSKTHIDNDYGQIQEMFGPSKWIETLASQGMPIDANTLASAYRDQNQFMTNIIHLNFVGGEGWWFGFAPLMRAEGQNQIWRSYQWGQYVMDPAPEETAPRFVAHTSEDHVESLTRWSIGTEMSGDFFKKPEGKSEWQTNMACMVSAGWITAKLLVGTAVINAKLWHKEWIAEHGQRYVNVLESLSDEISLFGALSKDDKGIYKLHQHVNAIMQPTGAAINMIVLAPGSLDFLALSGSYETEVHRRGEAVVTKRLMMGGRSLVNLFPGVTIYEDGIYQLENLSADQINQFVRTAVIGRYFMIDGSDHGEHWDEYPTNKVLSVAAASMDIDDYKTMQINTCIDKCIRYDDNDEVSEFLYRFANNVDQAVQQAGVKITDPELVDPYLWYDPNYQDCDEDDSKNSQSQYHVIKCWGDMHKAYYSVKQNLLHGQMAKKNLRKELRESDFMNIERLKSLAQRLYNVPDTLDESIEGLFFAVSANPENRDAGTEDFTNYGSIFLKANRFGVPHLPFVDKSFSRQRPAATVSTGSPRELVTGADLRNGAMYVKHPRSNAKLYVWVIEGEDDGSGSSVGGGGIVIDRTDRMFTATGNRQINENLAKIFDGAPSEIVKAFKSVNAQPGLGLAQPNSRVGYLLAPLSAFGEVDESGRAFAFRNSSLGLSNLALEALAAWDGSGNFQTFVNDYITATDTSSTFTDAEGNVIKLSNKVAYGIKPPRLVQAPSHAFGYGLVTGLRYLASLHNAGDGRGWNATDLEEAARGVESLDKYTSILHRIYPECMLFDSKYLPTYMLSGDDHLNKMNTLLANLWDHVKQPVWIRVPRAGPVGGADGASAFLSTMVGGVTAVQTTTDGSIKIDLSKILDGMGFDGVGTGTLSYPTGVKASATATISEKLARDALAAISRNDSLDPKVKDSLADSKTMTSIFAAFKTHFGVAVRELVAPKAKKDTESLPFASIFARIASDLADNSDALAKRKLTLVFNGLVSLVDMKKRNLGLPVEDGASLQKFIDKCKAFANESKKRSADVRFKETDPRLVVDSDAEPPTVEEVYSYVNTRLSVSEASWHNLAAEAEEATAKNDHELLAKIARHILRPSNPANPNEPLGTTAPIPQRTSGTLNTARFGEIKDQLVNLQYARASRPSRVNLDQTVFGNSALLKGHGSAPHSSAPVLHEHSYLYKASQPSSRQHVSRELMEDPSGPLYQESLHVTRDGRSLESVANVSKKKWLVHRYQKISKKAAEDDFVRIAALALCFSKVNKKSLKRLVTEKLPLPDCCYLIVQPFIQIRMSSGLWAQGGSTTAQTAYNNEDVSLQYNGVHKKWHMHYTIWLNCAIYDPTKFVLMQDIKFEGYRGGMDDSINDDPQTWNPDALDFDSADVKSCFIFSCGATFSRDIAKKVANPLSLYGRYDQKYLRYNYARDANIFTADVQWPSYVYYNSVWEFHRMHASTTIDNSTYAKLRESRGTTGLCPMANHKVYDDVTKDLTKLVRGSGHLDTLQPPMRAILEGKVAYDNSKIYPN